MDNPKFLEKRDSVRHKLKSVAEMALSSHEACYNGVMNKDTALLESVGNIISDIDERVNGIDNEVVETLALFGPEANELREFIAYLKITNEFERICMAAKKYANKIGFYFDLLKHNKNIHKNLLDLHACTAKAVYYAKESCVVDDAGFNYEQNMFDAKAEEDRTDELYIAINHEILKTKIYEKTDDPFSIFNSIRRLERSADHAVNICYLMKFARIGGRMDLY